MAEFPHPVRTLQHIGWVLAGKLEGATIGVLLWFRRRIEDEYRAHGPRDN